MEQPGAGRQRLDVVTAVFEGPLELLLALAEREEIDIFAVSLSALTEAYLAELTRAEGRDPVEMADFLWLAARLLLLKSIRLLPGEEPDPEEAELLGWEDDIRRRLLEYRAYKEMAEEMMARTAADQISFPPAPRPVEAKGHEEPIPVPALVIAFQSVLARIPPRPMVYVGHSWTMEQKVEVVRERLTRGPFDLVDLVLESEDRLEAVVTFVAILELLRLGEIRVRQRRTFEQIWVEAA
ncbi:MAG: segregation/condensation protein A [Candidatus Dormibacteraeota bacterium]|nr:segregation/condensation protein A [Candidatus Dormibacteraeota bacterium]